MSLENMEGMLRKAREGGYAVGNFDAFDLQMLRGIECAAEETKSPVIFAYCEVFDSVSPIGAFAAMARKVAEGMSVPAALHLDHANNFEIMQRALDSGFTSVMIDASDKSLKDNIAATSQAKKLCEKYGATLEAELGHVGGLEGRYEGDYDGAPTYTDVEEAKQFVRETGVDALAVAIGTVHGTYKAEPKLNIERLAELKAALQMPLALHGGSGLSDAEFTACVKNGITKLNIFTDMMLAAADNINEGIRPPATYFDKCEEVIKAVSAVVKNRMQVFGSAGKA